MRNFTIQLSSLFLCLTLGHLCQAQLIVADDFLYNQPTKAFGAGGGFQGQDYAGGANGSAGSWTTPWISTGDGVITGSDITEEVDGYNPDLDMFQGATRNGLSENHLQRGFAINDADDVVYFGATIRNRTEAATTPLFTLNDPGGESQVSIGFQEAGLVGFLGETTDVLPGPELTDGLDPYQLIGKLEINAGGNDERLTMWLNPTGVEEAEDSLSIEADILGSLDDLAGVLRLDQNSSPSVIYWDDVALGTTWESVTDFEVPRLSLVLDLEADQSGIVNNTDTPFDAIYYDVSSERGRIQSGNWESLESQGVDGWVASPSSNNLLIESNLRNSTLLMPGDQVRLGDLSRSSADDIMGSVATSEGLLNVMNVEFGSLPPLPPACDPNTQGDFDGNGTVEFADFLTLSSNFGLAAADHTVGDADCNGTVEFADFLILSANFGQAVGAESVPEPATSSLFCAAMLGLLAARRKRD